MRNFQFIGGGINVAPLNLALKSHPDLWDENINRKAGKDSPHLAMQDIWVRANDKSACDEKQDYATFNDMHYPIFYRGWALLPMLRPIVLGLMSKMEATHLGTILITKIPPGGTIKPHKDHGWNANFYNCKLYIPIQTNPLCWNRCEDEFVTMRDGEIWYFNNLVEHEVQNGGIDDRITLIVCMKNNE